MITPEQMIFMDEAPNPESIRRWGYDPCLMFEDVDEDLLLGSDMANYSSLLQLASDPECPKAKYALSIVSFHVDYEVLYRREELCLRLRQIVTSTTGLDSIAADWWRGFDPLIDRLLNPRSFSKNEASNFARRLLCGEELSGPARRTDFKVSIWKVTRYVEFSAALYSRRRAYLYVQLETGIWHFSRYDALKAIPLN